MIDVDHRSRMQLRQLLLGRRYRSRYRFTSGNDVKLFCSGTELFGALIERIDTATREAISRSMVLSRSVKAWMWVDCTSSTPTTRPRAIMGTASSLRTASRAFK